LACLIELGKVLRSAERAPASEYNAGYLDALRMAIEIVEEHEEDE
jgi:hypothetical protein